MRASATPRRVLTGVILGALLLISPAATDAADRARLSADLAAQLAAGAAAIDVIVHGTPAEIDVLAARYNLTVTKYLTTGAVLRVTSGQLGALQADGSQDHLSSDIAIHSSANLVAESTLADRVWSGFGNGRRISGSGIGVAVIDSGIDPGHLGLEGRVVASKDFIGGDGIDQYGHGTHVAAIIAGSGAGPPTGADYRGVAFGANLINLRVLDERGSGKASSVIEAIDWAIEHRETYHIRVINLSLGAPVLQPYRDDPLCEAVERATSAGIIVVASAGNDGIARDGALQFGGITSPGNDPAVLTVGALDAHDTSLRSDDTIAPYSSRGPTTYDLVMKPDLVAPGSRIVSAEVAGSFLSQAYPDRHVSGVGPAAYMRLSGTSMSAAVVSGAVALILETNAALTPGEAKSVLQDTADSLKEGDPASGGSGSLNILAAAWLADAITRGERSVPDPGRGRTRPWRIVVESEDDGPASPEMRLQTVAED